MKVEDSSFPGVGGLTLRARFWMPERPPRAVVVLVHGVTEHLGRYEQVANSFLSSGLAVCGFDLRGHGRSGGARGHVRSWEEYRSDLGAYVDHIRAQMPGLPLFVYAHSLGTLIALSHVLRNPDGISGLIVSGLAVDPVGIAKPWRVAIARGLSSICPRFPIGIAVRSHATLSRDPAVESAFAADPLRLRAVTVRWGTECLSMIRWVLANASQLRTPILLLHGGADPLNSPEGARRFHELSPVQDKTLILYPGGLHEPHNDLQREQVLRDVLNWIGPRLLR